MTHEIIQSKAAYAAEIEILLELSFGPGRLARAAERLRETNRPIESLAHIARDGDTVLGSISYWPIKIGETCGLLLGPLVVHPKRQGQGLGQAMMHHTLALVDEKLDEPRFPIVLLVGDLPYYEKAGFQIAPADVTMPGPVEAARLLVRGAVARCEALSGKVRPAPELC